MTSFIIYSILNIRSAKRKKLKKEMLIMSANNKSKVNVWIDKELYKAARTLAIQHELNWSTVIEEGLRLIIAELKKK